MESIGKLILEGHFSKLRDEVNSSAGEGSKATITDVLEQVVQYLEKLEQKNLLDKGGKQLFQEVSDLLSALVSCGDVPDKLPMAKAGKSAKSARNNTKSA